MALFAPAFDFMMAHEDPARSGLVTTDSGGRTRFGIAARFHPGLPDSFFTGPATAALAAARAIYLDDYWTPLRLAEISDQPLANKIFDMAVNMGRRQAALYLQRAANAALTDQPRSADDHGLPPSAVKCARLAEDGAVGPCTLALVNALPSGCLLELLRRLSRDYYLHIAAADPEQQIYLHGWLRRAAA